MAHAASATHWQIRARYRCDRNRPHRCGSSASAGLVQRKRGGSAGRRSIRPSRPPLALYLDRCRLHRHHARRHADAGPLRAGQYRDAVPADRGADCGPLRARSRHSRRLSVRCGIRFLLRAATLHFRGRRSAISGHVCGDAGGRTDRRSSYSGAALSSQCRVASRSPGARLI